MTDTVNSHEPVTYVVDAARLQHGHWCDKSGKTIGEGDIAASYSADRIGTDQPIRRPFPWQGSLWICTGMSHSDITTAQAYRLTQAEVFKRQPVSYAEKTAHDHGTSARQDPNGFYDGVTVQHKGKTGVLCGPPALFLPSCERSQPLEQLDLFGSDRTAPATPPLPTSPKRPETTYAHHYPERPTHYERYIQ